MTGSMRNRRGGRGMHRKDLQDRQNSGRNGRKLPEYLTPAEIDQVLEAAIGPRQRLLILLMWRAGLRVSEAISLRVGDVSLYDDPPTLKVRQGKGHKDRIVRLHGELRDALDVHFQYGRPPQDSFVLDGVHRTTAHKWVREMGARALPGRRVFPHIFRHSAARHWLAEGVPINVVSKWLGHATLGTTMVYLELVPDPEGYMDRVR